MSLSRPEIRKALVGFVSLLGSSVISAIGFIVIASNRWLAVEAQVAVFLILFVQWQTLGLTIAKTGIEQVVFAMVSKDDAAYLNPLGYVFSKALPLALLFSIVVCFVFSPWAGTVAFGTILLDTWSLIIMADLNARQRFGVTAASNLLNYPLFFAGIFIISRFERLTIPIVLMVFLLASVVRWAFLANNRFVREGMREVVCTASMEMGVQQVLNHLLFRADQIVLAILGLKLQSVNDAGMYIFLAKFPELAAGVMVVAGTVLFPRMYISYPCDIRQLLGSLVKRWPLAAGYVAALALALALYLVLWKGTDISPWLLLPFLLHTLAIILVNNITYSALRQGYLRRLLINLAVAVSVGLAVAVQLHFDFNVFVLAWIVPVQLLVFISLTFALNWGRTRQLYG